MGAVTPTEHGPVNGRIADARAAAPFRVCRHCNWLGRAGPAGRDADENLHELQGDHGLIEKAQADRKGDAPLVAEPILSLAPYRAQLEYRPGTSPAAVHEKNAELMVVLEGTGNIVISTGLPPIRVDATAE